LTYSIKEIFVEEKHMQCLYNLNCVCLVFISFWIELMLESSWLNLSSHVHGMWSLLWFSWLVLFVCHCQ